MVKCVSARSDPESKTDPFGRWYFGKIGMVLLNVRKVDEHPVIVYERGV